MRLAILELLLGGNDQPGVCDVLVGGKIRKTMEPGVYWSGHASVEMLASSGIVGLATICLGSKTARILGSNLCWPSALGANAWIPRHEESGSRFCQGADGRTGGETLRI
jgi:hypothetical protein